LASPSPKRGCVFVVRRKKTGVVKPFGQTTPVSLVGACAAAPLCFSYPIGSAIVSARLLADVSEDAAVNVQDQAVEKSERCPNNSSLFLPQAAVVVVAVQVLLSAQ